jgi:undecaprenyl-diphosphatase
MRGKRLAVAFLALALVTWGIGALIVALGPRFDLPLVRDLHATRGSGLALAARTVTFFGSPPWLDLLAALAVLRLAWRRDRTALRLAVAFLGAVALHALIVRLVDRPRPPVAHLAAAAGASFPSGHATESAALYGALAWLVWRRVRGPWRVAAGALLLTLIAAIGLSRPVLGVHYPSDVLAGWLLAAGWLAVVLTRARSARAAR